MIHHSALTPCRHLLTLANWSAEEIEELIAIAVDLKHKAQIGERPPLLAGKVLAQIYDKPSLRTRVSFEAAMGRLGGSFTFMSSKEAGLLGRESLPDVARVLSSFVDGIVIRTFSQQLIEDVAAHASCPVINGLSDERHPCQALTDLMTIRETFGVLKGIHVVFVGDGNNVSKSLAIACGKLGMSMTLCGPAEYDFEPAFYDELQLAVPNFKLRTSTDLAAAVKAADVIYTDVWASMGQEKEASLRKEKFGHYQLNREIWSHAPSKCRFLHCLPAHRGEEVTDDVIDAESSLVFAQAENRMHLAKGLLVMLLE